MFRQIFVFLSKIVINNSDNNSSKIISKVHMSWNVKIFEVVKLSLVCLKILISKISRKVKVWWDFLKMVKSKLTLVKILWSVRTWRRKLRKLWQTLMQLRQCWTSNFSMQVSYRWNVQLKVSVDRRTFNLLIYDNQEDNRKCAQPEISCKIPWVYQTLHLDFQVVVQEHHVDPPVFATELSYGEVNFVPHWTSTQTVKPRWVHNDCENEQRGKSNVTCSDSFEKQNTRWAFFFLSVNHENKSRQKSADDKKSLHNTNSIHNQHWSDIWINLKYSKNIDEVINL